MTSKSIYQQFIGRYILFLGITIVICLLSLFFLGWNFQQDFKDQQSPKITAEQIIKEKPEAMDLEDILKMGGWVQVLNKDYQVVYRQGVGPKRSVYTPEEVLTTVNHTFTGDYFTTTAFYPEERSQYHLLLVGIPAHKIDLNLPPQYAPDSFGRTFFISVLKAGILFLGLLIINILGYSYLTAKSLREPLEKLLASIKKMTGGQRGVEVNLTTNNQFAEIGTAFNQLNQELQAAEEEKERMEKARRRLLMNISHDLKTPLSSIQGYIEALTDGVVSDDKTKDQYLQLVKEKAVKMDNLLNDFFQFAKLESSDYQLVTEKQDLAEFLRSWFAHYIPELTEQGYNYRVSIPEERVMYEFDKDRLERALTNILLNAVKYNPAGTRIDISLKLKENSYQLLIADDGVGIEVEEQDDLFNPFVRGEEARGSKSGGSGLGLAIARQIIEKHGGEINLISKPGAGSKFIINLPD